MTGYLSFYDAAWPPASPPESDGVCVYIGGDTPHIWSMGEIAAQKARYRLPVFVRSNPPGPGAAADTASALAALKAIGAPRGILVAWDTETAADPAYIGAVHGQLKAAGYTLIVYGSQGDVMGNQNPGGLYWGADWTGAEHLARGDAMTQYVSFTGYDESAGLASLPFWDCGRPPEIAVTWQQVTLKLPVLAGGMSDTALPHWYVHRVQAIANAVFGASPPLAEDGAYGPATQAAIRRIQESRGITADGITGPVTWSVLLGAAVP